jgi:sugar diacid utilization regulator
VLSATLTSWASRLQLRLNSRKVVVVAVEAVETAEVPESLANLVVVAEVAEVASSSLMTRPSPLFEHAAPASAAPTKVNVKRLSHLQHAFRCE